VKNVPISSFFSFLNPNESNRKKKRKDFIIIIVFLNFFRSLLMIMTPIRGNPCASIALLLLFLFSFTNDINTSVQGFVLLPTTTTTTTSTISHGKKQLARARHVVDLIHLNGGGGGGVGFGSRERKQQIQQRHQGQGRRRIRETKLFPTALSMFTATNDPKGMSSDYPLGITRMLIIIGSCYLTWYVSQLLTNYPQYATNVMVSSVITLVCSLLFDKRLGQAALCGSFAGMCSTSIIPTTKLALSLGGITSILYEIMPMFLGVSGGRLGMTAFIGTSIVTTTKLFKKTTIKTGLGKYALLPSLLNGIGIRSSYRGSKRLLKLSALNIHKTLLPMAFWYAIGSIATIVLREFTEDTAVAADPVRASAVVGLAGALLFKNDKTAALAIYGGSIVGMSLPSKLMMNNRSSFSSSSSSLLSKINKIFSLLLAFGIAGAFSGLIHGATVDWKLWSGRGGASWGGKAGTCAFLGCIIYRTIAYIIHKIIRCLPNNNNNNNNTSRPYTKSINLKPDT
jgi:hypothetical protein